MVTALMVFKSEFSLQRVKKKKEAKEEEKLNDKQKLNDKHDWNKL